MLFDDKKVVYQSDFHRITFSPTFSSGKVGFTAVKAFPLNAATKARYDFSFSL